ncbi:MAG: glycosyltransferase family 4 protein [Planctomycetota bacterium]|jgi:glycosyltransferase involved in cell wall biosynthesis
MRILIVHQYFLRKDEAGGSRWNEFARYWADAGHEVTVLAGMVHYSKGVKPTEYKRRFVVREQPMPRVTVYRCHVSESYNRSFLGRFWAYLSFLISSTVIGIVCASKADIVVATSPPLTVAPTMWVLSRFFRVPAVFEVRDLWPESAIDTGVLTSKPLIWMSYRMEALAYNKAHWINALTPAFVDVIADRKGIPRCRISMIPNGADLDLMTPGPCDNHVRKELALGGKFVISYFGAHGRANRVGQLLDVAERVKNSHPDVRIMLVGNGMEKPGVVADAEKRGLDNVVFVDSVPKQSVRDYVNASDVCTAVLMKNDTFKTVYPNKVFDYMSCRKPIIIGIDGVARKLVEDAGAGLFAEPENADAFVAAIEQLHGNPDLMAKMGDSGYEHVVAHYSRKALAGTYLSILKRLVGHG